MYPMLAAGPTSDATDTSYSFYFKSQKPKRRKFLEERAHQLGCNPFLHYQKLNNGQSVLLENGTKVTPEMVLGDFKTSKDFLSVNLRDASQVSSFLENNAGLIDSIVDEDAMGEDHRRLQLIYHSMPFKCFNDDAYQRGFIARFCNPGKAAAAAGTID